MEKQKSWSRINEPQCQRTSHAVLEGQSDLWEQKACEQKVDPNTQDWLATVWERSLCRTFTARFAGDYKRRSLKNIACAAWGDMAGLGQNNSDGLNWPSWGRS